MITVTILSIGTIKEAYLRDAMSEYEKRLGAFCKLRHINIKEETSSSKNEASAIDEILEKEAKRISELLPPKAYVIALCIEGKQLSSEELAGVIERAGSNGYSEIVFIIGSSHGLSPRIKAISDIKLSFSKMTFPHQLMRVMLEEQIYRAFQINTGGKYHK